nr:phosphotransferase [Nocardioides soli]
MKLSFDEPELEAEHQALGVAQELDIRPLARAYRYRRGAMATFWISGRTADPEISPGDLVATLDRIHIDVPETAGLRLLGPHVRRHLDAARGRLSRAGACGVDEPLLERAEHLAVALASTGHRSYLHGDVHPTNVVTTGTGLVLLDPKGLVGDPAYDAAVWSLKADKLMPRRAWIDLLGADYGRDRVAGWAAIVGACHAVSYAAHGKRLDRVRAYAEIAREGLAAVGA